MTDQEPDTQPLEAPIEPLYTHPASPFLRTDASALAHVEMPALPPVASTWSTYRTQIEFGLAMLAYLMILVGSVTVLEANPNARWRYVVAALPVVPAALTLTSFIRASRWRLSVSRSGPRHSSRSATDSWKGSVCRT